MPLDFLVGPLRRTMHAAGDDLLSAGLGLAGLAGLPAPFADPARPTAAELRRRAIQSNWKGIADLGPLGGYGSVYGGVPVVPGREYSAFARLLHARHTHRVLCQIPDHFDAKARCLIVAPSSGSRGVYGAIAFAGAWGLPRGCAVAYTDRAGGAGYFDCTDGSGVTLDGTRAQAGGELLEFQPDSAPTGAGIATKHAHSGDHPEADWGAHTMQAARFGLAMLDEAFPAQAPFTPENTRIIAIGISNGGGAVLQAAGLDGAGMLDAVLALEPNVHVEGGGRALYDYATEAALLMPCALADARFATTPFARIGTALPPAWAMRGEALQSLGLLSATDPSAQAAEAMERLCASGWEIPAIESAACSTIFDMWRAVAVTYASAYLRRGMGDMPCGFSFQTISPGGQPGPAAETIRAAWWSEGSGIPPDVGIALFGGSDASADPTLPGLLALRELWQGGNTDAKALHAAVARLAAKAPRHELPIWIVHGADDGLIPAAFTSDRYVEWLRTQGRSPRYWRVPHAQHFDAFLAAPGFGDRHVPLLPYGYAALDRIYAHVVDKARLPEMPTPHTRPRGPGALDRSHLG
ncbi:MAG TPA: 3-hydroxybutyrate oligomer hydrolase family protein [Rhodanobacteraceae bacterium]|nr:3-hydroxybutyrate oligomer hydrolase family protein [Rhodanobacteraceae bacterium]